MNTSSWFPVRNFTKSAVNRDWMVGTTKFANCKDGLNPRHKIVRNETVFWNRSKNNLCVSLESYRKVVSENDEEGLKALQDMELPSDIKL